MAASLSRARSLSIRSASSKPITMPDGCCGLSGRAVTPRAANASTSSVARRWAACRASRSRAATACCS